MDKDNFRGREKREKLVSVLTLKILANKMAPDEKMIDEALKVMKKMMNYLKSDKSNAKAEATNKKIERFITAN